ncbi:hypothetical protein [Mesorhizobium sp. NZP2298]|uniref:hypothetical protein n=1 Tax=Mesorhizobium sp. NZP2298 TaxID=2483403 RepID=UPI0019D529D6|nr:hypothetical protein [Mesorhizobium sp. NZP2298]
MVHVIPLSIAKRRLDTGNAPQYPQGSPIGGAMQGLGDHLAAVAERYQQMKDQQDAFDAEIARRRFNGQIAQAEDEVAANAPADGAGLHEAMYGQVNPYDGRVVKTGLFDKLFAAALPNMPESQRAAFAGQKEAMRRTGGLRMAARQLQRRKDYEQAEVDTALKTSAIAIARGDPNDSAAFEAKRQDGLDLIAKIGGDAQAKLQAMTDWLGATAKARVQALIAKDPKRATELLSAAQAGTPEGHAGDTAAAVGGAGVFAKAATNILHGASANNASQQANTPVNVVSAQATPDEMVVQAFREQPSPGGETAIPLDAITYLKPSDFAALKDQANNAAAAQMIGANARVMLAEQNAPAVLAATGKYPENVPTAQDFVSVYGVDEGSKRLEQFRVTTDVAKAYSDMYPASNQAIHAELRDIEPGPDGSPEARERYEIKAGAAGLIMAARDADPVAYVSKLFSGDAPDWSKVKTPQDFQAAVTWVRSAQKQLGFSKVLSAPREVADRFGAGYVDENVPLQQRVIELSEKLTALRDPEARLTFAGQVFQSALARLRQNAADNPKITPAELEAQGKALQANLVEMATHPAQVRFNAGSWWQKPLAATNDTIRLMANGATFGQADKLAAGMNSVFSDKSYDELLAAEQAETEDAEDRAGSATIGANLLGAFITGQGFQSAGLTFTGRVGAESAKGLQGLFARSATAAADGAVFGGVDAALNGRDIAREMGSGALFGAGGNALAEGLGAVGRGIVAKVAGGSGAKSSFGADIEKADRPSRPVDPNAKENYGTSENVREAAVGLEAASRGSEDPGLHLFYMPHWTAAQRAAADLKVAALNMVEKIVTPSVRAPTSASVRYKAEGHEVPTGQDVDHVHDLQLGGAEATHNMAPLDSSVNRSLGPQIYHRIKHLPHGTRIGKVTIGDR